MSCYNKYQLFDFINKELPEEELRLIKKHLQKCSSCKDIYNQKIEEIKLVLTCDHEFKNSTVHIPEFIFPEPVQSRSSNRVKSLIIRLSIAATILMLISFSILFLTPEKKNNFELELAQLQEEMLISDMNEAWNNQDLIFTQINTVTGETEVFLSSEIDN